MPSKYNAGTKKKDGGRCGEIAKEGEHTIMIEGERATFGTGGGLLAIRFLFQRSIARY